MSTDSTKPELDLPDPSLELPAGEVGAEPGTIPEGDDSETPLPLKTGTPAIFPSESETEEKSDQPTVHFSVRIEGPLTATEKETLISLLAKEQMDIREFDLEPQLEAGRILLPGLTEYAAILITQKMRGTSAFISCLPESQSIQTLSSEPQNDKPKFKSEIHADLEAHPARSIILTNLSTLPGFESAKVIDLVTATAVLETTATTAESTDQYAELLARLQDELRFKSYHRGAKAVLGVSVQLKQLDRPWIYQMIIMGSAVKL